MVKNTNTKERDERERYDYELTKEIMTEIFKGHSLIIEQTQSNCPVDVRMTGDTKTYAVEIKWQTNGDWYVENYGGFLLKQDKYNYMCRERKDGEKLIVVYLLNSGFFYIFDIDREITDKKTKDIAIKQVRLKREQYNNEYTPTEWQWCYELNAKDAVCKGRWQL